MVQVCRVIQIDWEFNKDMCIDFGIIIKEGVGEIGRCLKGIMKLIKGFEK